MSKKATQTATAAAEAHYADIARRGMDAVAAPRAIEPVNESMMSADDFYCEIETITVPEDYPTLALPDPEAESFAADIEAYGQHTPILIVRMADGRNVLADGLRRLRVAQELGWLEIQARTLVAGDEGSGGISPERVTLSALAHRRHLTKSQIAFVAMPTIEKIVAASKSRRESNLRKDGSRVASKVENSTIEETMETIADKIGVHRQMLFWAAFVHRAFRDGITRADGQHTPGEILREQFQPGLLGVATDAEGEMRTSLSGVYRGIKSLETTAGTPRGATAPALERFCKSLAGASRGLAALARDWQAAPMPERTKAETALADLIAAAPYELAYAAWAKAETALEERQKGPRANA
jgi:hypothetical protein